LPTALSYLKIVNKVWSAFAEERQNNFYLFSDVGRISTILLQVSLFPSAQPNPQATE
jgi:hypothetical protein